MKLFRELIDLNILSADSLTIGKKFVYNPLNYRPGSFKEAAALRPLWLESCLEGLVKEIRFPFADVRFYEHSGIFTRGGVYGLRPTLPTQNRRHCLGTAKEAI